MNLGAEVNGQRAKRLRPNLARLTRQVTAWILGTRHLVRTGQGEAGADEEKTHCKVPCKQALEKACMRDCVRWGLGSEVA